MNKLTQYRRFIVSIIGILPLILSLGTSKVAFAATATSDLSITLVADQSKAKIGQTVTYTARMTNLGPDDAIDSATVFSVPDQLTILSYTCEGVSPDGLFCEYGTLAPGETVVTTLVATPTPGTLTHDRRLTVTANAVLLTDCSLDPTGSCDPDLSNNSVSVTTKLIGNLAHP